MTKQPLEHYLDRATQLHARGYNCAQCVAMVFDDVTGTDAALLARMTAALGGGIGGTGHACGAVTGMTAVVGLLHSGEPADKPRVYGVTRQLVEQFGTANGAVDCRQLKGAGKRPCIELIKSAVALVWNTL